MKKFGKELEFISRIRRDGSGTSYVTDSEIISLADTPFDITCLSIGNKTYIASQFNSYVVKFKNK